MYDDIKYAWRHLIWGIKGSSVPRTRPRKFVLKIMGTCAFILLFSACVVSILVFIDTYSAKNKVNPEPKSVYEPFKLLRLPNDTRPVLYELLLKPDLETGDCPGLVNITINITRPRDNIMLHSKDLIIEKIKLSSDDRKHFKITNLIHDEEDEIITIKLNRNISAGIYFLNMKFKGSLLNRFQGFSRSRYRTKDGVNRTIATSKFEPTYARQAFPCFDEPNLKAKYKIRLFKPKDESYIALSNNPQESIEDVEGGQIVTFKQTVPMSTYLVCFIVSDFVSTSTTFQNGDEETTLKVYATPAQLDKTEYAKEVGKKVIEYYINFFGLEYPLPKLDMVAIPDFVSGAMEHWGLVTYRETALLYSAETHSSANKQRVATVVAHELAHSWFGNLVTMNWWNDLWLNEGFASYIEYKGVAEAEPEWGMLDQFLIEDLHTVLSLDATLGSHPIIVTVETPDEITSVFDTISYNKGAAVLRMLENTVGDEIFKKGVTKYLQHHIYGNAVTQNLLEELDNLIDLNVTDFMATFTSQMGYPILDVVVDGNKYVFTQKRFLKDSTLVDETHTPYDYKWTIPITYITNNGKSNGYTLFKHSDEKVTVSTPTEATWVKFNYDQIGYYRVNYPLEEWEKLTNVYNQLSVSDKTHLIEESFSIAEAGQLKFSVPLSLTKKLIDERNYVPWSTASTALSTIKAFLTGSSSEDKLNTYIGTIVDNAYNELTWNEAAEDSHLTRLARVVVLGLACSVKHEECLNSAKDKFNTWIADPTKQLSQDLRGLIYRYGMKNADVATWDKLFEIFSKETDANEKLKLLYGLASVNDLNLLKKLLTLAEDETYIRSQDYFSLISYICANSLGPSYVWDYMRDNWAVLSKRFGLNDRNFGRMIITVTKNFATEERVKEIEKFYSDYPDAGAGASPRVQALETVNNNIKWLKNYKAEVEEWLTQNS